MSPSAALELPANTSSVRTVFRTQICSFLAKDQVLYLASFSSIAWKPSFLWIHLTTENDNPGPRLYSD